MRPIGFDTYEDARKHHQRVGGVLLQIDRPEEKFRVVDFDTAVDMRHNETDDRYEAAWQWASLAQSGCDEVVLSNLGILRPGSDEDLANARLIAAAPDLLAQLQALVVQIESIPDLAVPPGVRAAIDKATPQPTKDKR